VVYPVDDDSLVSRGLAVHFDTILPVLGPAKYKQNLLGEKIRVAGFVVGE
jgi:hypothetical protein